MDAETIAELFAPVVRVTTRRMFGGHGIYAEGLIFAIEIDGQLYLKADAQTRPAFEILGMKPFTYDKKTGAQAVMAYYALPDAAYDDEDDLKRLTGLALAAARRAGADKALKAARTTKKPG